jgi:hypothetical protein
MSDTHCDEVIDNFEEPDCIRYFLLVNRLPATLKAVVVAMKGEPVCFASYENKRVRIVMASRFGDVGITHDLKANNGYTKRVSIDELSDFNSEE